MYAHAAAATLLPAPQLLIGAASNHHIEARVRFDPSVRERCAYHHSMCT